MHSSGLTSAVLLAGTLLPLALAVPIDRATGAEATAAWTEVLPPGATLSPSAFGASSAEAGLRRSPAGWTGFSLRPGWPVSVLGGVSPPVCADLDPASPGLETVVGTLSSGTNLYVFRADGTIMPGWPRSVGFFVAASPTVADIDGDGHFEIVVGDWGGNRVWALRADGEPVPGWPISVGGNVRSTAAVADLDPSYPGVEIVVGAQDGQVYAWHADGTVVPGWPVVAGDFVERSSPAVGDADGDGQLEVFVGSWYDGMAGSTGGIYGFHHDGVPLSGWPQLTAAHVSMVSSPALVDLNGDGHLEVVSGTYETDGKIYVWNYLGRVVPGWPYTIPRGATSSSSVTSSPAIADVDGDGAPDIVCGSTGQCGTVYALKADGSVLPGWPAYTNAPVDGSSPVVGDLDGDGSPEIVIGSSASYFPFGCTMDIPKAYVFRADGMTLPGWPVDLWNSGATPSPAIADLSGDGCRAVLLSFDETVLAWDAPVSIPGAHLQWPFFHSGIDHTGVYRGSAQTSVTPGTSQRLLAPRVEPNPGGGSVRLLGFPPMAAISILDVSGRLVTHLEPGSTVWNGLDAQGRRVAPGVYLLRPSGGTGRRIARSVRLQ